MGRYAYKTPRRNFVTEDGLMGAKHGKYLLHTLYIHANTKEQALKRIRKTVPDFIFIGEVDENNIPIPKVNTFDQLEVPAPNMPDNYEDAVNTKFGRGKDK